MNTINRRLAKALREPHRFAVIIILFISVLLIFFRPLFAPKSFSDSEVLEGTVVKIISIREIEKNDTVYIGAGEIQTILVEFEKNGRKQRAEIENNVTTVREGEKIFIEELEDGSFTMVEFSRTRGLLFLSIFFIALVLLVSGKKGFNSLVGLVFSFAIIFSFIVPRILNGMHPVTAALIGAVFILCVTLYTSYGFNKKSLSALIGISVTLLFVGLLAQYTINALHFTGLTGDESSFLKQEVGDKINLVTLIIAGIIIAAIGILDDVAITQASTVFTLASTNTSLTSWDIFKKAMTIGKDHISAVINTLILAYTGAALPLVLLLSIGNEVQSGYIASIEFVAEEIVRTLVSSSGLVLAVPITTTIAIFFLNKKNHEKRFK